MSSVPIVGRAPAEQRFKPPPLEPRVFPVAALKIVMFVIVGAFIALISGAIGVSKGQIPPILISGFGTLWTIYFALSLVPGANVVALDKDGLTISYAFARNRYRWSDIGIAQITETTPSAAISFPTRKAPERNALARIFTAGLTRGVIRVSDFDADVRELCALINRYREQVAGRAEIPTFLESGLPNTSPPAAASTTPALQTLTFSSAKLNLLIRLLVIGAVAWFLTPILRRHVFWFEWPILAILGGSALVNVIMLLPGSTYVRVAPQGLVTSYGYWKSRYRWDEVEEFKVVERQRNRRTVRVVGFNLVPPARDFGPISWLNRNWLVGADREIPVSDFAKDPDQLCALLREYRTAALKLAARA